METINLMQDKSNMENSASNKEAIKKLIDRFFDEDGLSVERLSDDDFKSLLFGLSRVYSSRIMNCVDATGRYDREWGRISSLLKEACRRLGGEAEDDVWDIIGNAIAKAFSSDLKKEHTKSNG